jgi:hypothetical protein
MEKKRAEQLEDVRYIVDVVRQEAEESGREQDFVDHARELLAFLDYEIEYAGRAAEMFRDIITHLDFVACVDEEDYVGSSTVRYVRETLIPFCEREGGLKTSEELFAEFLARQSQR